MRPVRVAPLLALLVPGAFAASMAIAEDRVDTTAPNSMLSEFVDPELKFAEGCGCYVRRLGAAESDGLLFFGKLGDLKESGWIALRGKLMEVLKEKPDVSRIEKGKTVRTQSYRSSDVTVQLELTQRQANEAEETSAYTGEIKVLVADRAETVQITGTCGC